MSDGRSLRSAAVAVALRHRAVEKQAQGPGCDVPSAAASLHEGRDELYTVNRPGSPPRLSRCLTTNLIESSHFGVRLRTRHVTHWKDATMVCSLYLP